MKPAQLRFLVVEDHAFQRRILLKTLENLGAVHVQEAANGHSALEIFRSSPQPVDIILTDLDMPGMDGIEFLRHIGESRKPVSVVLVSAVERSVLASVETMAAAYGITLLGTLQKPITATDLETLILAHWPPTHDSAKPAKPAAYPIEQIAAALENGAFEAYFQPKVDLATREVKCFEALARWRHPQAGLLAPDRFIELMERHALIDGLTWQMLDQSAAACCQWRESGRDICVSVNLSVASLADVNFADRAADLVRKRKLDPRNVILEVTESAAVAADAGPVLENLSRLRLKGFGLSIDDYGTGYSSIQQLSRVPFTELKIDRSFLQMTPGTDSRLIILRSSLDMAKKLHMVTVAEGIETQQDWDLLRNLGCDLGQGYFVARPMSAGAVPAWIDEWNGLDNLAPERSA